MKEQRHPLEPLKALENKYMQDRYSEKTIDINTPKSMHSIELFDKSVAEKYLANDSGEWVEIGEPRIHRAIVNDKYATWEESGDLTGTPYTDKYLLDREKKLLIVNEEHRYGLNSEGKPWKGTGKISFTRKTTWNCRT